MFYNSQKSFADRFRLVIYGANATTVSRYIANVKISARLTGIDAEMTTYSRSYIFRTGDCRARLMPG